ncbi:MAG TPA: N-formylglutamate amidohydrolase [Alphaproteobacteria bacterium]|nr:N-formylglutamate amidohydrolase [Alphaproteobacteria bacterium]
MARTAAAGGPSDVVHVEGGISDGKFVILCDHASNRVPPGFGNLGLGDADMQRHIAWDPGALPVARGIARRLASPLVFPDASRLLIDCNRRPSAPDAITVVSEETPVPGNRNLSPEIRGCRVERIYDAYHRAIDALIEARAGRPSALVAVHSFTPVFRGVARPWHVGVVVDHDRRLATPLLAALRRHDGLMVGENEPYSPADGVYHTLERHAASRRLPAVMIEIRNDQIETAEAQEIWASRLADALRDIV